MLPCVAPCHVLSARSVRQQLPRPLFIHDTRAPYPMSPSSSSSLPTTLVHTIPSYHPQLHPDYHSYQQPISLKTPPPLPWPY
eukprot:scaffold27797_cov28-Tisochrysis_lutea.AAC.1